MTTPDQPTSPAEREAAALRAAMDADDDVPAHVMLSRAQHLADLRELDLQIAARAPEARADLEAARAMMRHVREHPAVPAERLADAVGRQVRLGVLGREPGQVWRGTATLAEVGEEHVDDPLLRTGARTIGRVRLVAGTASTWVWADRVIEAPSQPQVHPLVENLDQVPAPVWMGAQQVHTAAYAVAIYALGYEVYRVAPAPGDGRLPPGMLGTVACTDTQDAQLTSIAQLVALLRMQRYLAEQGQEELVLAAVDELSGIVWRKISERLTEGLVVWRSRAVLDAQRLLELPQVDGAIDTLVEALQDGPVDVGLVEQVAEPARAAVRETGVWVPYPGEIR